MVMATPLVAPGILARLSPEGKGKPVEYYHMSGAGLPLRYRYKVDWLSFFVGLIYICAASCTKIFSFECEPGLGEFRSIS